MLYIMYFCACCDFVGRSWLAGLVFIIGLGTAVLQSSLFGFASQFPPIFNQAMMAGQGIAGIVASVLRIITKGSLDSKLTDSALLYFALVTVVMVACIVFYVSLLRMDFTKRILALSGYDDPDLISTAEAPIVPSACTAAAASTVHCVIPHVPHVLHAMPCRHIAARCG